MDGGGRLWFCSLLHNENKFISPNGAFRNIIIGLVQLKYIKIAEALSLLLIE
mgnify:CR=1 FL=1